MVFIMPRKRMRIKKATSFLLALAIVMNMGMSAGAQPLDQTAVPPENPAVDDSQQGTEGSGSQTSTPETPEAPAQPDETPEEPQPEGDGQQKPMPEPEPEAPINPEEPETPVETPDKQEPSVPEKGEQTNPQPEEPDSDQEEAPQDSFRIDAVTVQTDPQPLTSDGGKVVFTVSGQYLNKEHIWLKLEKSGTPFQIIPVKSTTGFLDAVKKTLLPSSNITTMKSDPVTLDGATEESMFVYTVSVCHSEEESVPDLDSSAWKDSGIEPLVVPKAGGEEPEIVPPEEDITIGESGTEQPEQPETPDGEDDVPAPGGDVTEPEPETPDIDLVPGESEDHTGGDVPDGDQPPVDPEPVPTPPDQVVESEAEITGAESSTMPSPLTADGGYAMISVSGQKLSGGSVWVRILSDFPDFESGVYPAKVSGDSRAYTDKILLPRNNSSIENMVYHVSVMHRGAGSTEPGLNAEGWLEMPSADIVVPKREATEVPPIDEDKLGEPRVDSVQSVTTPDPLTSAGGLVCISVTGVDLNRGDLWVMLDSGDNKPIIKKIKDASSTLAVSQQFAIPANEGTKKSVTYKTYLQVRKGMGTPLASDSNWKRYSDAAIVVPPLTKNEQPTLSNLVWTPEVSGSEIKTRFYATGKNLGEGENSVWVKIAPDGSDIDAKIVPVDQSMTATSAESQDVVLKQKTRPGSDEPVEYVIFAMAKTNRKKPSARDDGWKKFSSRSLTESSESIKPRITAALVSPTALPGDGGVVTATIAGENLSEQTVYVVGTPKDGGEPVTKQAVPDAKTGDLKANFALPANDGTEQEIYTFQYQTGRNASWNYMGAATLYGAEAPKAGEGDAAAAALTVECQDKDGAPIASGSGPLPSKDGKVKLTISNPEIDKFYYVKIDTTPVTYKKLEAGTDSSVTVTITGIENTDTTEKTLNVYLLTATTDVSDLTDTTLEWGSAVANFKVKAPDVIPEIETVTVAPETLGAEGGNVTVTVTGTGITKGKVQLKPETSAALTAVKLAEDPAASGSFSGTIVVPSNTETTSIKYNLYVDVESDDITVEIPESGKQDGKTVTVAGLPNITGATFKPTSVWSGGGKVTATFTGTNFVMPTETPVEAGTQIYAELRLASGGSTKVSASDIKVISSTEATAVFELPENSTNTQTEPTNQKDEVYQLYAKAFSTTQVTPSLDEIENVTVTVMKLDPTETYAISTVEYFLDANGTEKVDSLTAKGGYAKVTLTGTFDASKYYYVKIGDKIKEATVPTTPVPRGEMNTDARVTGYIEIPENTAGNTINTINIEVAEATTQSAPTNGWKTPTGAPTVTVPAAPAITVGSCTVSPAILPATGGPATVTVVGTDFDTNTTNKVYHIWVAAVKDGIGTPIVEEATVTNATTATASFDLLKNSTGTDEVYSYHVIVNESANAPTNTTDMDELTGKTTTVKTLQEEIKSTPVDPESVRANDALNGGDPRKVKVKVTGTNLEMIGKRGEKLFVKFVDGNNETATKEVTIGSGDNTTTSSETEVTITQTNDTHTARNLSLYYIVTSDNPPATGTTGWTPASKTITLEGLPTAAVTDATLSTDSVNGLDASDGTKRTVTVTPTVSDSQYMGNEKLEIRFYNPNGTTADAKGVSDTKEVAFDATTHKPQPTTLTISWENKTTSDVSAILQYRIGSDSAPGSWQNVNNVSLTIKGTAGITKVALKDLSDATVSADGKKDIALDVTGVNLQSEPTPYIYVRVKDMDTNGKYIQAKQVTATRDTAGIVTIDIPKNDRKSNHQYAVEYKVYYNEQTEEALLESTDNDWKTATFRITVQSASEAKITSVTADPSYLNYSGRDVNFLVKGTGLEEVAVWLRPASPNAADGLKKDGNSTDGSEATVTIRVPDNKGVTTIYYDICATTDSAADIENGTAVWERLGMLPVFPETKKQVTSCSYKMEDDTTITSAGGKAYVIVKGNNMKDGDATVWVKVALQGSSSSLALTSANGETDSEARTNTFTIPANDTDASQIYDVQVVLAKANTDKDKIDFSNPLCKTQIVVPSATAGLPKVISVEEVSRDGGKVTMKISGEKLTSGDVYLYVDAPSTVGAVKAEDGTDEETTAELTLPSSLNWIAATYPVFAKVVGKGEAPPAYPGDGWKKTTEISMKADSTNYNGPLIETIKTDPEQLEYAEEITYILTGKNLENKRIWIFRGTGHVDKNATSPKGSWYTITDAPEAAETGKIVITDPAEGLNCFYIVKTESAVAPSSLENALHLGDYTLLAKRDDTAYVTAMSDSVIEAGKEAKVRVDFQKNYFPTDADARALYKARAVKSGDTGTVVTDEVALTNFSAASDTAEATLTFPSSTVKGEEYEIQLTEDGTTWKVMMLASNHTDKAIITTKGGSGGDDNNNGDNNNNGNGGNDREDSVSYVAKEELEAAIKKAKDENASQVVIYVDRNLRASRDFFERAQYNEKDIVLDGGNFKWTIPAGSRMNTISEKYYDLGVTYSSAYESKMKQMVGSFNYFQPFSIKYDGYLPTRMLLTLNTYDNFKRGADLYVYRYNVDKDDATKIAEPVVSSTGVVSFMMTHCSDYFMTNKRINESYLSSEEERIPNGYFDDEVIANVDEEYPGGGGGSGSSSKLNPNTGL